MSDVRSAYPEHLDFDGWQLERWTSAEHCAGLAELCADPVVMTFLGGPVAPIVSRELSQRLEAHWERFDFGLWAVVARDGRTAGFAGACRALWHPEFADEVEIGWRLARWAWGSGYATAGGRAGAQAAFEAGHDEVVALVHPDNQRSLAVVERLEMRRRGHSVDPNLSHDLEVFALARNPVVSDAERSAPSSPRP
jgi:RimJ/RimL family protein N-acetyltransferase